MKRAMIGTLVFFLIGLAFWASYTAQGSYVDEEGILRVPIYLLAMGWLFILLGCIGILGVAGIFVLKRLRKRQ